MLKASLAFGFVAWLCMAADFAQVIFESGWGLVYSLFTSIAGIMTGLHALSEGPRKGKALLAIGVSFVPIGIFIFLGIMIIKNWGHMH
jgi:hypothetical protein